MIWDEMLQYVLEARYGRIDHMFNTAMPGWWDIITEALDSVCARAPEAQIGQVKEKFGGLRIYIGLTRDENGEPFSFSDILREAEYKSLATCAICGSPGSMRRGGGYVLTLCDEHAEIFENSQDAFYKVWSEAEHAILNTLSAEQLEEARQWEKEHAKRIEEARAQAAKFRGQFRYVRDKDGRQYLRLEDGGDES